MRPVRIMPASSRTSPGCVGGAHARQRGRRAARSPSSRARGRSGADALDHLAQLALGALARRAAALHPLDDHRRPSSPGTRASRRPAARSASGQPPSSCTRTRSATARARSSPAPRSRRPGGDHVGAAVLVPAVVLGRVPVARGVPAGRRVRVRALDVVRGGGDLQPPPTRPGRARAASRACARGGARAGAPRRPTPARGRARRVTSSPAAPGARRSRRPRAPTRCPAGRRAAARGRRRCGRARAAGPRASFCSPPSAPSSRSSVPPSSTGTIANGCCGDLRALDRAVALEHVVVGRDLARHRRLAEPEHGLDDHPVAAPVHRVAREQHAGDVGAHHPLHHDRHPEVVERALALRGRRSRARRRTTPSSRARGRRTASAPRTCR